MARLPRFVLPGQPQHVIQRGNNRQRIFRCEADYLFFLDKLKDSADTQQVDIHAYVLMTNHVHLLVTPHTEAGIGCMMQSVGRHYVRYFNDRNERTGTLWEGRYKATLVDSEHYLLACYRYIELNPVRAGMVSSPVDYRWSSFHANGLGRTDTLTVPHSLYTQLGDDAASRQSNYRALFESELPESVQQAIRDATNKAWVLGGERFQEEVGKRLNRRARPTDRGGDRRSAAYRRSNVNFNRV